MPDISGLGEDDDFVAIMPQVRQRSEPMTPIKSGQPVMQTSIDDDEWAKFQKWKTRQARRTRSDAELPEYVNIQVEAVENMPPTGHPVGVNGNCFIIKPGVPQKVPSYVIEVLRNAKIGVPVIDPVSNRVTRYEDRLRLPFTILPEDEDFDADEAA